jgi:molybdopterin-binding protein
MEISARNVIAGKVAALKLGAVAAEIQVDIGGGTIVTSVITMASAERIDKMIAENETNEVLTTTLKALRMASRYKDRLAMFNLRGVEVDLTLGLPPSVSVRFV